MVDEIPRTLARGLRVEDVDELQSTAFDPLSDSDGLVERRPVGVCEAEADDET
jgi:hypothetical protein